MRVLCILLFPALAFANLTVPERKFVESAASEHMGDVELGRLALEKSTNPEVKNQAQQTVDQHKKALDKLKSIARDQKFPLPTTPTTRAQSEMKELSKLEGAKFDHEYKEIMQKRAQQQQQVYKTAAVQNPDLKRYIDESLKQP